MNVIQAFITVVGENVVKSWTENDTPCITAKGVCQHFTSNPCDGSYSSLTCGGPEERKCCVKHKQSKFGPSASTYLHILKIVECLVKQMKKNCNIKA